MRRSSGLTAAEFSTVVESDVPVIAERDDALGHASVWQPRGDVHRDAGHRVVSAEGATINEFDLSYLIQNPNATAATVQVRYLLPVRASRNTPRFRHARHGCPAPHRRQSDILPAVIRGGSANMTGSDLVLNSNARLSLLRLFVIGLLLGLGMTSESQAQPVPQNYWGPMEPTGNAHAGPQVSPGSYELVWAVAPTSATPSRNWPWAIHGTVVLVGGHRYFIQFNRGQILVYDEMSLPSEEQRVRAVAGQAIVWFRNNSGQRIAAGFRPLVVNPGTTGHSAVTSANAQMVPQNYWGPMEPTGNAHAGPRATPGPHRLVWAVAPTSATPSANWPWADHGPVTLIGGHRYFIQFNRGQILVHDETALPSEEQRVRATADHAVVWYQNNSGKRIAVALQPVKIDPGASEPSSVTASEILGTYAIVANGYRGVLEISGGPGGTAGRVRFDYHGRWEDLTEVSYSAAARSLSFTRPRPGGLEGYAQRYVGQVDAKGVAGTFSQQGSSTKYQWQAARN